MTEAQRVTIQLYLLGDHAPVPLTVNGIANDSHTVFGAAVRLAMVLIMIDYLTLKETKQPFWPGALWLTLKQGMFAFGVIVSGAVIWQRVMGGMPVSLLLAAKILSLVAGLTAGVVNYMTIKAGKLL